MAMKENSKRILNYLKEINGENVTAADVAEALGLEKKSVDGSFTSAIRRKGLGVRVPAEIELEDGTHKQVKFLTLTPAGVEAAEQIYERHTILTALLTKLGVDRETAAEDACKMEHVISDESLAAIKQFVTEQM